MDFDDRPDDELLSTSGIPRWLTLLVAAVSVIVVGGVIVAKVSSAPSPTPAALPASAAPTRTALPASAASATVPSTPSHPTPLPSGVTASPLQFVGPPTTIVADGPRLYAIDDGSVVLRSGSSVRADALALAGTAPEFTYRARIALDAPQRRLWVLIPQDPGYLLVVLDARTLATELTVYWSRAITGFVAEGGALWVIGPAGLYRLPETGGVQRLALPPGRPLGIAADPIRGRVLVLQRSGAATSVLAVRPGSTPLRRLVPGASMIAATGTGRLWVAGGTAVGSYLVRLDPADLHVVGRSLLGAQFSAAPTILAAGQANVLIGSDQVGGAWCVRGDNGSVSQYWNVAPRAAAMSSAGAYAVLDRGLVRLNFARAGCTG